MGSFEMLHHMKFSCIIHRMGNTDSVSSKLNQIKTKVIYLTLAIVLFWLWQHILETGCPKYQVKAEKFSDGPLCSLDAALHLTGPTEHINIFK